jgi:signal transduction histidine kinase
VSLELSSTDVVVVIDDDGPGLGANAESLFVPFQRGTSKRADSAARGVGAGLGLAIARRVAIAHGGHLDAGASPRGGARFRLAVPRANAISTGHRR